MEQEKSQKSLITPMDKKPIGIVVDNGADLPQEFIEKNQIEQVFHQLYFPGEQPEAAYQLEREKLYQKMREMKENKIFPRTSFAPVGAFRQVYQRALEKFENVLAIILTSQHSGAFNAANQAKNLISSPEKVEIFDSLLVSVPQGILTMKAQEMINQGGDNNKKLAEIVEALKNFREKIKMLAFLNDFSWATSGGRLSEKIVKIIEIFQKRGIKLALTMKKGRVGMAGIKFSAKDRIEAILQEIKKQREKLKVAISHSGVLEEAERLKSELEKIGHEVLFITEITTVLVAHSGPGAIIVSYYSE